MRSFLNEEERSKILELRSTSNMSIHNISKQLRRGAPMISKFLSNPEDYVKEMEVYLATPPHKRNQPKKPVPVTLKKFLTEAEREKINIMKAEGKSTNSIATLIGRGSKTIKTYLDNPDGYEELITKETENLPVKKKMPTLLSSKDRLRVQELKQNNYSPSKIAEKMRKSRATILTFLNNPNNYEEVILTINKSSKKLFNNKINGMNNLNNSSTKTVFKRYLTEDERNKILEMRSEHTSIKTISRLIHRSIETISKFLKNPQKYLEDIETYESLKSSRKEKKKLNHSYISLNQSVSEDTLKNANKVSIEHRSVIKFLVKKGNNAKIIWENLQEVYGKRAPDLLVVSYWTEQFEQGRETIVNDPKTLQKLQSPNGVLDTSKSDNSGGTSNANVSGGGGNNGKKPPVKVKLFQFKFKPTKRLT